MRAHGRVEVAELSKLIEAVSEVADECEAPDPESLSDGEPVAALLVSRTGIDLVDAVLARRAGRGPTR
jgi:hypothetical protein